MTGTYVANIFTNYFNHLVRTDLDLPPAAEPPRQQLIGDHARYAPGLGDADRRHGAGDTGVEDAAVLVAALGRG